MAAEGLRLVARTLCVREKTLISSWGILFREAGTLRLGGTFCMAHRTLHSVAMILTLMRRLDVGLRWFSVLWAEPLLVVV